jgi:hypothetical protein
MHKLFVVITVTLVLTDCASTSNSSTKNGPENDTPLYASAFPTTIPGGNTSDWQTLNDRAADLSDPNNPSLNGKR